MMHSVGGQRRKPRVEIGSDMQRVVVIVQQLQSLLALLGRIEGARRKFLSVDFVARYCPVNLFDGCVIDDPGSHPAIESQWYKSIFFVGVAWRERLKFVECT